MGDQMILMKNLLKKLYTVVTGGDNNVQKDTDNFIVWCAPGIPFSAESLRFAWMGLGGGSNTSPDEVKELEGQLRDFSRIVNAIPDPSGVWNGSNQDTVLMGRGDMIWERYKDVLDHCEVPADPLTEGQKKKLKRFRNLLSVVEEYKDIMDDEGDPPRKRVVEGPLVKAYNIFMSRYDDARLEYNMKRIGAMNAETAALVQDWTLNASTYRRRVQTAYDAWVSQGKKNDYEAIMAYIDQVGRRNMALYRRELLSRFDLARLTDMFGGDYWPTFPIPGRFAEDDAGWTEFEFRHETSTAYESESFNNQSFQAHGERDLGALFKARVEASGSRESGETFESLDMSDLRVSFKLTQVQLARPWFAREFITGRTWRWARGQGDKRPLSDGARDTVPQGLMPAWPVSCLFIKDVVIDFKELHDSNSTFRRKIKGGASASFGWLGINSGEASGKFSFKDSNREKKAELTKEGLKVPGLQLVGLKCTLTPKSPNPDPTIENWQFGEAED